MVPPHAAQDLEGFPTGRNVMPGNNENRTEGRRRKFGKTRSGSYSARGWRTSPALFLCLAYAALVLSLGITLGTGMIPAWGKWYSREVLFRRQTQAFLAGSVAVNSHPSALGPGMAWAGGGVQQVGGLGVPAWRLPFDAVAKGLGWTGFPDRLAFGLFMAAIVFWILRGLTVSPSCHDPGEWISSIAQQPETMACALLLVFFPPFLSLCRSGFGFHEESSAYAYLLSIALLVGAVQFVRKPRLPLYCGLAASAGLAGFFRPAALAGGIASLTISFYYTRVWQWARWKSLLGVLLFGLGTAALFATNHLRFGSGFEFGSGLTVETTNGAMFASRFSHPYASEPLFSAVRELFSILFLAGGRLTGDDWSRSGIFPGQSHTFRRRELNFSAYDLSFLVLMMLAWGVGRMAVREEPAFGRARKSVRTESVSIPVRQPVRHSSTSDGGSLGDGGCAISVEPAGFRLPGKAVGSERYGGLVVVEFAVVVAFLSTVPVHFLCFVDGFRTGFGCGRGFVRLGRRRRFFNHRWAQIERT
jgi:hypothetical protein